MSTAHIDKDVAFFGFELCDASIGYGFASALCLHLLWFVCFIKNIIVFCVFLKSILCYEVFKIAI